MLNSIESKINFLEKKLNRSNNSAERAECYDNIKSLKRQLKISNSTINTPEIIDHIDAPVVADRKSSNHDEPIKLERGQIMNSGDSFRIGI